MSVAVDRSIEVEPGVRLGCTVSGRGPAMLLMHGAEADRHMFDAVRPHLDADFTVIAYDQRDCGETVNPPVPCDLGVLARDAQALLAALGFAESHVFGSSFGGRVAQMLASRHPDCVDALVLGSTWALPDRIDALNPAIGDIQALRARLPESAETLIEFFLPPAFLAMRPDLRGLFRRAQPGSDRGVRRAAAVADRPDVAPEQITQRCLVIAGSLDRVVPPAVTLALAERLPAARAVLLDGLGHATVLQDPVRVADELRRFCLEEAA